LTNAGNGNFGNLKILVADRDPRIAGLRDLNADGYLDLGAFALQAEKFCTIVNDGAGNFLTDQTNWELGTVQ
jgi:hypothetical protein